MGDPRPHSKRSTRAEYEARKETRAIASDPELMAEIRKGLRALEKRRRSITLEQLIPRQSRGR